MNPPIIFYKPPLLYLDELSPSSESTTHLGHYYKVNANTYDVDYIGVEEDYLLKYLAPLVKKGGQIVAVPGLKEEFTNGVPAELQPYWFDDMSLTLHSCDWWHNLWKACDSVRIQECKELKCLEEAWQDWLLCDNEYARRDIGMMKAEGGNYFNLVSLVATKL